MWFQNCHQNWGKSSTEFAFYIKIFMMLSTARNYWTYELSTCNLWIKSALRPFPSRLRLINSSFKSCTAEQRRNILRSMSLIWTNSLIPKFLINFVIVPLSFLGSIFVSDIVIKDTVGKTLLTITCEDDLHAGELPVYLVRSYVMMRMLGVRYCVRYFQNVWSTHRCFDTSGFCDYFKRDLRSHKPQKEWGGQVQETFNCKGCEDVAICS